MKGEGYMTEMVFEDRYTATGRPHPNPWTICKGDCEGMGFYPSNDPSEWPEGTRPLGTPEPDGSPDDGWRFIKCPDCRGTGRRVNGRLGYWLDILHTYYAPFSFAFWYVRVFPERTSRLVALARVFHRYLPNAWRNEAYERALIRRAAAR